MNRLGVCALASVAVLGLGLAAGTPVQASERSVAPTVINGDTNPPLAGAAIALETSAGYSCSGSLWRSRIVVTAAHCLEDAENLMITAEDITLWNPGANTTDPPSDARVTDIIMDEDWLTYADDGEEATARDLAFLILDRPLGDPVWTRMATPAEVAALTWNEAFVEFVGYGITSPTVDPNASLSPVPAGLVGLLSWGYNGGLGAFTVPGDEVTGTCGGDSGGPWVSRVGQEVLFIGPLSGGQGLPCDKPEPADETFSTGAVASANTDMVNVALATAGEAATPVPRTCIKGKDIKRTCWQGQAWEYDYCWSAGKAELWKRSGKNKWSRVDRYTGYRDEDFCGKRFPYRIIFRGIETTKKAQYEVYLPTQRGLSDEWFDPFTVTVSG